MQEHGRTSFIECIPHIDWVGVHLSRGVLVKFSATEEDIQAVKEAADKYEGNNEAFYRALAGNPLRDYMRDPSKFGQRKAKQSTWSDLLLFFLEQKFKPPFVQTRPLLLCTNMLWVSPLAKLVITHGARNKSRVCIPQFFR